MNDNEIIAEIHQGQIEAYSKLVERYQLKLQTALSFYCQNRQEIEYFLHESFVKAYLKLEKFDTKKSFYPWLKTISLNLLRDEIRKRKNLSDDAKDLIIQLLGNSINDNTPDDKVEALGTCISELDQAHQQLMKQRYWQKISIARLSELMQRKPSAVKMQLMRTRESLKLCIKNKLELINE